MRRGKEDKWMEWTDKEEERSERQDKGRMRAEHFV